MQRQRRVAELEQEKRKMDQQQADAHRRLTPLHDQLRDKYNLGLSLLHDCPAAQQEIQRKREPQAPPELQGPVLQVMLSAIDARQQELQQVGRVPARQGLRAPCSSSRCRC
jgi:hypothetical protein